MGRARLRERYVYPGMALAAIGPAAALAIGFSDRPALAQSQQSSAVFLPDGKLKLPTGFRNWVFVGGPLTPNGLNGGKANFPEFHNVYIEPGSFAIYEKTGQFPEGTMFFKELELTLPAENPDGSRSEPSGRGFFPGPFNGADVTVKDTKRYADTDGWGYYNFHHYEPKAATASVRPKDECAYCHIASARYDDVWTQFYPMLDEIAQKFGKSGK